MNRLNKTNTLMKCGWHSCENETVYKYCSDKCKNKYHVDKKRKSLKLNCIDLMGGSCKRCGWKEHRAGLVFHHLDPSKKEFTISSNGYTRAWDKVKEELDKCVLLCQNCHHTIHATNDPLWLIKDLEV